MNQQGSQPNSNRLNVPEAQGSLDNMKFEIARGLGINFKQGYNGDLTSRENGYVGGYMVNPVTIFHTANGEMEIIRNSSQKTDHRGKSFL